MAVLQIIYIFFYENLDCFQFFTIANITVLWEFIYCFCVHMYTFL